MVKTSPPHGVCPCPPALPARPSWPRGPRRAWISHHVTMQRLLLALAFMAILASASCSATTGRTSSTTTRRGAPRKPNACLAHDVKVSLGDNAAGAGQRAFVLVFRNVGSSPCELTGYPMVVGLDASGSAVGSTVYSPESSTASIVVDVNSDASVNVATDAVPTNGSHCFTYSSVRVSLPGDASSTLVALRWNAPAQGPLSNGLDACQPLGVGPFVAGVRSPQP